MQGVRTATGVMVLSTALLIGSAGGAVAAADTGTSDSTSGSSATRDSGSEKSASSASTDSVASSRDSVQRSITSVTDAIRDPRNTGESRSEPGSLLSQETNSTQSPAADLETDDAIAAEESAASVAAIDAAAVDSEQIGEASITDAVSTGTESVSTGTESEVLGSGAPLPAVSVPAVSVPAVSVPAVSVPVVSGSVVAGSGWDSPGAGTVAASPTTGTSTASDSPRPPVAGTAIPSVPTSLDLPAGELEPTPVTPPAPLVTAFTSMTFTTMATVAASLGNAAAAIPAVIWSLPYSTTPISDVIALLETILASVTESVTVVARLPADLVALLGTGTVGTGPVLMGEPADHRMDLVEARSVLAESPQTSSPMLVLVNQQSGEGIDIGSGFAEFGPTALAAAFGAPIKTVPASVPAMAGEYESLFDRAFGALLVPLSLWALATGALPGLVGLLVVFGAGARVGYRQAKAGFAVRVGGIARFAGPGPLGVVRSGSLVALHQRGVRAGGQRTPFRYGFGDQAA